MDMRAIFLTVGLWAIPACAQFTGLVTTDTGTDLLFASTLPLRGSGQPVQGRIYKIGSASPINLVASVTKIDPPNPCTLLVCMSSAYNLFQPDISEDGAVLSYTGVADCVGLCSHGDPHDTTVLGVPGQGALDFNGQGRLSSSGRYFVYHQDIDLVGRRDFYCVDLQTGEKSLLTSVSSTDGNISWAGRRVVADSGDFTFSTSRG